MRRAAVLLLASTLVPAPLSAQADPPQPILAEGETVEVQLTADLNGDGNADLAYVAAREDHRELRVVLSYVNETDFGHQAPEVLALDPYPLGDAQLSVSGGMRGKVLVFEDLTGGTTAVASTHRFRWDVKLEAMRLIGLDATLYSRTFAHDGKEASWNLLTGDLVTRTLRLNKGPGDAAYDKVGEKKRKKPSPPLRLEYSPSGDDLLGWPGAK
ncbi:MAG: hypothetical protein ACKO1O_04280 [Erythrobacter sp.]